MAPKCNFESSIFRIQIGFVMKVVWTDVSLDVTLAERRLKPSFGTRLPFRRALHLRTSHKCYCCIRCLCLVLKPEPQDRIRFEYLDICSCQSHIALWLRWLVAGLSLWWPRFAHGSVHVGFVVEKVSLRQVFLRVFQFLLVSIIPQWLSMLIVTWGMNSRPVGGRSSET
jgi:hypothetical protein